jgi:site-specific DNA recombinase
MRYIRYGRMSSKAQNPESPEQQYDKIDRTLKRLGHDWVHVDDFRDDAISGKYFGKRPGLQGMLTKIRAGLINIDVILVSNIERFGRADVVIALRHELRVRHGILVLTADSRFTDPTTAQGRALTLSENMRATEDGPTKREDVLRGKWRAAEKGRRWPGGPAPLGYKLKTVFKTERGSEVADYSIPVPDPAKSWIVVLIFEAARETGWGTVRLARYLNERSDIPTQHKPFYPDSIGHILDNTLYFGELTWAKHSTGIDDDTRWVEKNPECDILRVADFCEPLISRQLWDAVQGPRRARSEALKRSRARDDDGKQLSAVVPGITLTYPLSGLLRCGECGRSMRPMSSKGASTSGKKYMYYHCANATAAACSNKRYLREPWLRETVVARLRERLFPPPEHEGDIPEWFPPLVANVARELGRRREDERAQQPDLEHESEELTRRLEGWKLTLGDRDAPPAVRADIQSEYNTAKQRIREIEAARVKREAGIDQLAKALDPEQVLDRLHGLADVLVRGNATELNLELSRHIDGVDCYADGRAVMRTAEAGIFEGLVDVLSKPRCGKREDDTATDAAQYAHLVKPRRRGKLRVLPAAESVTTGRAAKEAPLDLARFAGLAGKFLWKDVTQAPQRTCWSKERAAEVRRVHEETGLSMNRLAKRFGVSRPTIRRALAIAKEMSATHDANPTPPARRNAAPS